MLLEFSVDARNDLKVIYRFGLERFGESRSDAYFTGLLEHIDLLKDFPESYVEVPEIQENCRRSVFKSHAIYYERDDNQIFILRILGKQDPLRMFDSI